MTAPSRKWFVAQVAALATFFTALIQAGWDLTSSLQIVLVGLIAQAIATYLIPNKEES
jgi:hypothetical protein